jgi:hypothetical protein
MDPDLHTICESVYDEASFILFLSALAEDRADAAQQEKANPSGPYGSAANGWENGTIESFLESASAWAEASKRGKSSNNMPPENTWRRCADILLAGKYYE